MAHNKALSSFLTIVLVLASLFVLTSASEAQTSTPYHFVQGGSSFTIADFAAQATHGLLTCDGCSGGGSGPG